MHKVNSMGKLMALQNFEQDVVAAFSCTRWSHRTIDVRTASLGSRNSISEEQLIARDKRRRQKWHCLIGRGCQAPETRPFRFFECLVVVTALEIYLLMVLCIFLLVQPQTTFY